MPVWHEYTPWQGKKEHTTSRHLGSQQYKTRKRLFFKGNKFTVKIWHRYASMPSGLHTCSSALGALCWKDGPDQWWPHSFRIDLLVKSQIPLGIMCQCVQQGVVDTLFPLVGVQMRSAKQSHSCFSVPQRRSLRWDHCNTKYSTLTHSLYTNSSHTNGTYTYGHRHTHTHTHTQSPSSLEFYTSCVCERLQGWGNILFAERNLRKYLSSIFPFRSEESQAKGFLKLAALR